MKILMANNFKNNLLRHLRRSVGQGTGFNHFFFRNLQLLAHKNQ